MYEETNVQNLIVFENHFILTDDLRKFDPYNTLIHFE